MAMTANTSQNHQSASGNGVSGDAVNASRKNLPSPWAQVVRGEPESILIVNHSPSSSPSPPPPPSSPFPVTVALEQPSFADCCSPQKPASLPPVDSDSVATESCDDNNANAGRPKKAAWNKPSDGVAELSPVMGAVSWPALSESTKPSLKSSPAADSSSKTVSDGSMPNSQGPVIPQSPQKQVTNNAKSNSAQNHTFPGRQKSMRRGVGGSGNVSTGGGSGNNHGGGQLQSSFTHLAPPPPPPLFPVFAMPSAGYNNMVQAIPDHSPREPPYRSNNWEPRPVVGFVPPPPLVNDHRNSSWRGSFGQRGEGSYHNNLSGSHDQDWGRHGNVRDAQVQPQRASPRGFVRPPPNAATFVPPVATYGNPMPFTDFVYFPTVPLESYRGMPFIPQPPLPPAMMPVSELPLSARLVHQVEYYFSDANLVKDEFLKSNMDEQGWVPITLIAGFNREVNIPGSGYGQYMYLEKQVKNMTGDIQLILDSLRASTDLEVQDDKVRRRHDWMKWTTSSSQRVSNPRLQASAESSYNMLTTSFKKIAVDELRGGQEGMTAKLSPCAEHVPLS